MQSLQFSVTIPQWIALKTIGKFSRKAFYKGPLATLKLVDRSAPELPSNQWVKIKTLMCGFCASDLNLIFLKDSPSASPFTSFPCVIGHDVKLDLTPLWLKLQTLKGVYGCGVAEYNGRQRHMFDIAISMVNEGKLLLDGMVSHTFTLQDFDKMIEVNLEKEKHKAIKTVVSFRALLNN